MCTCMHCFYSDWLLCKSCSGIPESMDVKAKTVNHSCGGGKLIFFHFYGVEIDAVET